MAATHKLRRVNLPASLWSETVFNRKMREAIRSGGLRCMHIRETDKPGVADLLVYRGEDIVCWLELKLRDEGFEPAQPSFLLSHIPHAKVARLWAIGAATDRVDILRVVRDKAKLIREELVVSVNVQSLSDFDWTGALLT